MFRFKLFFYQTILLRLLLQRSGVGTAKEIMKGAQQRQPKINYTCIMNPQLKKIFPIILILILAALTFAIRQCTDKPVSKSKTTVPKEARKNDKVSVDRDKGFDRRVSYLEYSKHAKCRMECRKISEQEVEQIMLDGKINYYQSEIKNARCPEYAVEGVTTDEQRVRIIFGQCNNKTVVITVIDLDREWTCSCPGDDKKYQNKN